MKTSSCLVVCSLVLLSTLLMKASAAEEMAAPGEHAGTVAGKAASDCGGEPCDAVARGFFKHQPSLRDWVDLFQSYLRGDMDAKA